MIYGLVGYTFGITALSAIDGGPIVVIASTAMDGAFIKKSSTKTEIRYKSCNGYETRKHLLFIFISIISRMKVFKII